MITSIGIIQGPCQKFTKNRYAKIIKRIPLNLKGVKFGTTFLYLSKLKIIKYFQEKINKYYLDLLH